MGKLNYFVMAVRVKMLLFLRERLSKKIIYQKKNSHSGSVFHSNKRHLNLPDIHSEYRIHLNKEHITNFLN